MASIDIVIFIQNCCFPLSLKNMTFYTKKDYRSVCADNSSAWKSTFIFEIFIFCILIIPRGSKFIRNGRFLKIQKIAWETFCIILLTLCITKFGSLWLIVFSNQLVDRHKTQFWREGWGNNVLESRKFNISGLAPPIPFSNFDSNLTIHATSKCIGNIVR